MNPPPKSFSHLHDDRDLRAGHDRMYSTGHPLSHLAVCHGGLTPPLLSHICPAQGDPDQGGEDRALGWDHPYQEDLEMEETMSQGKLTDEQKARYLLHPHNCPFCNSDSINEGETEGDGSHHFCTIDCDDCGRKWIEQYKLEGIEDADE